MSIPVTAEVFTTEDAFRRRLPTVAFSGMSTSKTSVGQSYIDLFCGFQVVRWADFCPQASRHLVDHEKRTLSEECKSSHRLRYSIPRNEADVRDNLDRLVLDPVNQMLAELSENETHSFRNMSQDQCNVGKPCLKPDYVLAPIGDVDQVDRPVVVVEVKTPNVNVGVGLNMLQASLGSLQRGGKYSGIPQHTLYAFLQVFSYCAHAKTCFGLLSSYVQTRFLHIVPSEKIIQISDVVRYDQVWDDCGNEPHIHQAILYLVHLARSTPEDRGRVEMEEAIYCDLPYEGGRYNDEEDGRGREENDAHFRRTTRSMATQSMAERESVGSGTGKGGPCDSRHYSTYRAPMENISFNIYAILRRASNIPVGHGLTGNVFESTTDKDRPVVVKSASFKDIKCLAHVENEVRMYKYLTGLQGRVVPRMIGFCKERYLTTGSLMLVTEKVGSAIVRGRNKKTEHGGKLKSEGFYVDGLLLHDANLNTLKKLSLQGIREIHSQNILHGDVRCGNMRVELRGGKVRKVWWIDFGLSEYCVNGRQKKLEENEILKIFDGRTISFSPI